MKSVKFIFLLLAPLFLLPGCSTTAEEPASASVKFYFEGNGQVEIISPQGTRVMLDVWSESDLTQPPTADDVLLTTHLHPDHYDSNFAGNFPGTKMQSEAGERQIGDVKILAMLSSGAGTNFNPKAQIPESNIIYIIETGGIRFAHFGDIAQTEFTPNQIVALHDIDIAMTVLVSSYGDMTIENKNGFRLMDEIQPKIIVANHDILLEGIQYAVHQWGGYALTGPLTITREKVPAKTTLLLVGMLATTYQNDFMLPDWE